MSLSTTETQADVLVAGAGAAGLSTALALAQAGFPLSALDMLIPASMGGPSRFSKLVAFL